jgi:hypothetical protein
MAVHRLRSKYQAAPGDYGGHRALVRVGLGTTDILIGREDLTTWSDEELRRGRKRDKNGGWQGKDPIIVAKAVHDELVRRTLEKANTLLTENLEAALSILVDIMKDEKVEPKDRITAIKMITDRAMGKEPTKVEITGDAKWELAIADSIVSMPAQLEDQHREERDEDIDGDEPAVG